MTEILMEKYRPKNWDEVIGNKEIVESLKAMVEENRLSHCLFSGPPGCGKTTLALIVARKLFGGNYRINFLELNASDERGINVMREKVKTFAKTIPLATAFKIIFLDEADSLTRDAQEALRRMMEVYSNGCRFILSCNTPEDIINPIKSRCTPFRFVALSDEDVIKKMGQVCLAEKIAYNIGDLTNVAKLVKGDLRLGVNMIQALIKDGRLNYEQKIVDNLTPHVKIIENLIAKNFITAKNGLDEYLRNGFTEKDFLLQLHNHVIENSLSENKKYEIIKEIAWTDYILSLSAIKSVQMDSLFIKVIGILNG